MCEFQSINPGLSLAPDKDITQISHSYCSSYIYNRKTGGSDTWWLQTSPQKSLRRLVSGALHIWPYISALQRRDLREAGERTWVTQAVIFSSKAYWTQSVFFLTCQGGIEVFELYNLIWALTACQAATVYFKVLCDGLLHVSGAAAEVSVIVKHHTLQENTLDNKEID